MRLFRLSTGVSYFLTETENETVKHTVVKGKATKPTESSCTHELTPEYETMGVQRGWILGIYLSSF